MNYYERHIGDYLKDTAHLSLLEHGVYTRLLDVYYTRESAIPDDQVARLIGARSKDERDAMQAVLEEFFERTEAGWIQSRCEREIARYLESEPEREQRRENDRERQRRSRERRRHLFDKLRESGVVPPFDTKTSTLESMLSRVTGSGQSRDASPPVTRDNTATHSHTHTHTQLEIQPPDGGSGSAPSAAPPSPPPDFDGKNAESINGRAIVRIAKEFELPEEWGLDAERLGFKSQEVLREAEKFRQYFVAGKGEGTRRSLKGWRQSWSTWLGKAAKDAR